MVRKNDYWSTRLANATWDSYNDTNKHHKELVELYRKATDDILVELYKIEAKFGKDGIITRSNFYRAEHLKRMKDGFDSALNELGEEVEQTGTLAILEAGKKSVGATGAILKDVGLDINYDRTLAKKMLQNPWHGATFSQRVWKNTSKLSRVLNDTVKKGVMTGKSTAQIAMELSRTMDSKLYEASRLVRSETMHHLNEVNKVSMKESGVKQVQEIVTLDERTSDQCAPHNKLVHDIDKAPILPRHPNCRCVLVAYIDVDKIADEFDRREKESLDKIEEKGYNKTKELYKSTNENRKYYSKVSKTDFKNITRNFIKSGGIIQTDEDAQRYLDMRNADGICFNESLIFIRPDCSYTELLEEIEHSKQFKSGVVVSDNVIKMEIEAKEKVLENVRKYNIPEIEIEDLKKNLKEYVDLLEELEK
ncbi:minor capsid protein [Eubacteriales bacterium KG125]